MLRLIGTCAALAALVRLIAFPRVDAPVASDAIVALDGDRPRRIRIAVTLAAAGYAPVLVVVRAENAAPELLEHAGCLPFELISVTPNPASTRGEARAVAALATRHGWDDLLVVTSTFHVGRARLIFKRAIACNLRFVAAGMNSRRLPGYLASETSKFLLALTLRRAP